MAQRTSELYSKVAKQDGVVTEVTDKYMVVTYKDGSTDSYELGYTIGEASGEYHKHNKVTDFKVGDKFKDGDILGFDDMWFERDIYNPGQVAMKTGTMATIALMDGVDEFEDSISISADFADLTRAPYIKRKAFMLDVADTLVLKVKVGDEVDYESILCEVEEQHLDGIEFDVQDEQATALNRFGIRQIKSHHHGKITKIDIIYNADKEDMSESVLTLVNKKDKELAKLSKVTGSPITSHAVHPTGGTKKQSVMPGKIKVLFHIESEDEAIVADKYVVGNQMKGTINSIYTDVVTTVDGRVVDMKFSFKSLFARMVLSLRDKLVCNGLTKQVSKQAVDIYYNRGN